MKMNRVNANVMDTALCFGQTSKDAPRQHLRCRCKRGRADQVVNLGIRTFAFLVLNPNVKARCSNRAGIAPLALELVTIKRQQLYGMLDDIEGHAKVQEGSDGHIACYPAVSVEED
jgi:hypothetical protein